ncbi:immunoglobulin kappa light chain-like isoform X1 [Chiloscyllium plagiosum]|uniref:immunoglobulin kappa light chain-like isoform X1 n=1 Tax=Chiloscyllium plagiosum TaxID=36176 RepID=UPI001CB7AE11|nr:immunoglobulin kappa light chain-like isoform X1 [Chiloscyllium plagiosum]
MYLFLGLMISFYYADSQTIHQTPAVVSSSPGKELKLKCTVQGTSNPDMYWYRQDFGKGLRFMFYSRSTTHIDPEEPVDGFTAKRPSDSEFNLHTSSLRVDHSAVYYCAWIGTDCEAYFGDGTKLVVFEGAIKEPSITIFQPSPEEVNKKQKATVVCLISNFYPDNVKITWLIDNEIQQANDIRILTDPNSRSVDGNKSYSITSRLRLEARDFVQPRNVACKADHYTSEKAMTYNAHLTISVTTCGIRKEERIQSMGTAKLTYLILFCKSILYAVFVSFLAWKTKISSSKRFD